MKNGIEKPMSDDNLIVLTADIVSAHIANNSVAISDLNMLIVNVHGALAALANPVFVVEPASPAVPVRTSIKPDYLICLEDGKKLKMLKRYLMTNYQMTPDDYRTKWKLPADYPMVAPNYAEKRRALAFQVGLGRKMGTKVTPKPNRPRTS